MKLLLLISSVIAGVAADSLTSKLVINNPVSLAAKYPDGIPEEPGLFGIPAYGHGKQMTGKVVYGDPNNSHFGCEPFNIADSIGYNPDKDENSPLIVMVDRGGDCHFVTKARNIQQAGGSAMLVANNKDDDSLTIMADDGTGSSIVIPCMLIKKKDGDVVKEEIKGNAGTVIMSMKWNLPSPDGRVEWNFWTSAGDNDATQVNFKRQFASIEQTFGNSTLLTPNYFILDGVYAECVSEGTDLPCGNQCTNSGRYCAIDPEGDILTGLDGADIVRENLRQMCIVQHVNKTDTKLDKWWKYVVMYQDQCNDKDKWGKICAETVMDELEIDKSAINKCYEDSGGADEIGPVNKLLEAEVLQREFLGVFQLPLVRVNGQTYTGSFGCPDPIKQSTCGVLREVCAGFQEGTAPDVCLSDDCALGVTKDCRGVCGGNFQTDQCGQCLSPDSADFGKLCVGCDGKMFSKMSLDKNCNCLPEDSPKRVEGAPCSAAPGMSIAVIVVIVLICVVAVGVGVFCYMQKRESAMREDIDSLLKQYLPLEGQSGGNDDSRLIDGN